MFRPDLFKVKRGGSRGRVTGNSPSGALCPLLLTALSWKRFGGMYGRVFPLQLHESEPTSRIERRPDQCTKENMFISPFPPLCYHPGPTCFHAHNGPSLHRETVAVANAQHSTDRDRAGESGGRYTMAAANVNAMYT